MSEIVEKFKSTFRDLMEQKGIGIGELAKELHTSRFVIHKWLTVAKDMRINSLLKIADYFKCSIEYLCGRTDVYLGFKPREIPKFSDRLKEVLAEHNTSAYRLFKDTKIELKRENRCFLQRFSIFPYGRLRTNTKRSCSI